MLTMIRILHTYKYTFTIILVSLSIWAGTYKHPIMRLLVISLSVLLAVFLPTTVSYYIFLADEIISVTDEFFKDDLIIYRAEYDVADILFPLNALNRDLYAHHTLLFFILADFSNGQRVDKGLYIRRDGTITKLLDSARVSAAPKDHTRTAYFGTANGLYHYNFEHNTAEKYGTITDGIISLVKANHNDTIYVLTDDYTLYKVTDQGTKKEKIEKPANVRDIVFDINDNLFLHTADKTVHIMDRGGVQKVEGLDKNPSYLKIYKAPFFVDNAIALIANNMSHLVFSNGTMGPGHCEYFVKPTAYSLQPLLLQHYGYKKNIYELNFLQGWQSHFTGALERFAMRKQAAISTYSTAFKRFLED